MKLSTRLTLALAGMVILTAAGVGLLTYHALSASLLDSQLDRLGLEAGLRAAELDRYSRGAGQDLLAIAHLAALQEPVRPGGAGDSTLRDRLAEDFVAMLEAHPAYLQLRLIGVADQGREIVRVDRAGAGGAVRRVPEDELQPKGDRDYFTAALELDEGELLVSPIELNEEHGEIQVPPVPVLRVATPLYAAAGRPFGVVVIHLDLRPAFDRLRTPDRAGGAFYLIRDNGEYLVHADPRREHGLALGRPARFSADFPDLADLLREGDRAVRTVRDGAGHDLGAALVPVRPAGGPRVTILQTVPFERLVAGTSAVGWSSFWGALAATVVAVMVAMALARSLSRPLGQITAATEALAHGEAPEIPTATHGEIGTLANAFSRMTDEVRQRELAEERFRLAVEASPSGMVMVDAEGTILLVNAETERLFGYRRDELIGMPVEKLVPGRVRTEHAADRQAFAAAPAKRAMGAGRDLYGLRRDGTEFPVEIGLNPIPSPGGLLVLGVVVDITERKATEEALAARTRDLERSNAELEQFAYVASHDLQEPLRMVASYTELLAERYQGRLDEKADKYIHYAVDGAQRMRQLVSDLLTISRVGTQGKPFEPTDSAHVVRRVLTGLCSSIEESGAEIVCGELPTLEADEGQLGQVFQNLIGNAIKFRSEEPPRIRIDASQVNGGWEFRVTDNGIGIDPAYSESVFQMFKRLHERGKYEGSGIGLAIVKKIVERHGGRVWFESDPGGGATFHFTVSPVKEDVR